MKNKKPRLGLFDIIIKESQIYTTFERIEDMVQTGMDLSSHPVWPLFMVIRSRPPAEISKYLSKFSPQQRQLFLDMDFWSRDDLDIEAFSFWIKTYALCSDFKISLEFLTGPSFELFLKSKFNIWTFDTDDPLYPDHDNYFLTDDNMLLFEYDDEFELAGEVRNLIRIMYSEIGVEHAYVRLFKLVSNSYTVLSEDEYHNKKGRLRDVGIVDYFDALALEATFSTMSQLFNFLKNRSLINSSIDNLLKKESIPYQALTPFSAVKGTIAIDLEKVNDPEREAFLNFDFIRLINAGLIINDCFKDNSVRMHKVGEKTKLLFSLGHDFTSYFFRLFRKEDFKVNSLFDFFEFSSFYRIGNTLIKGVLSRVNRSLRIVNDLESFEIFMGQNLLDFLDSSKMEVPRFSNILTKKSKKISNMVVYDRWCQKGQTLINLIPFINRLHIEYKQLIKKNILMDDYYINYNVDEIDFEAVVISSFANYFLKKSSEKKLGLTKDEFLNFTESLQTSKSNFKTFDQMKDLLRDFKVNFGFENVFQFEEYLYDLLREQLDGYDYLSLKLDDFKHIGGPILLK